MGDMERWKKLNVYVSSAGFIVAIISLFFVRFTPFVLCLTAFALGIAWKGFKNIYKNVEPPTDQKEEQPSVKNVNKKKKKKKR